MKINKDVLAFQANDIIRLETYKKNALTLGGSKKEKKFQKILGSPKKLFHCLIEKKRHMMKIILKIW